VSAEKPLSSAVFAEVAPAAVLDAGALEPASGLFSFLRNALDRLPPGETLDLRSTAPHLPADLTSWCRLHGHELRTTLDAGNHTRYLIAKGPGAARWPAPDWGLRLPLRAPIGASAGVAAPFGAPAVAPSGNEDATAAPAGGGPDLRDSLVGRRAEVPEVAPRYLGFVPRGAVPEPGLPDYPFALNARADVWAEGIAELYEQAVAQQWHAGRDIPWTVLPALPDDLERAVCQLMTFLAENEYAALYIPSKFLPRINSQYIEPVLFLAAVINDEARHIEVFTKRALANGGGLQYATALTERSLHGLFVQEDYFRSSFLLHVLGEGTFLDLLSFIEYHSPDPVTREIVRRARIDEGRHVAYGLAHVRGRLLAEPALAEELEAATTERAAGLKEVAGGNPFVTEALAVLAGGGRGAGQLAAGMAAVRALQRRMHTYRVRRMRQVGLDPARAERISALHTPNYM
jgi:TusA-related sulfurtransferase